MAQYCPSSNMYLGYDNLFHSQSMHDSVDEFLTPLLFDPPNDSAISAPAPIIAATSTLVSLPAPEPAVASFPHLRPQQRLVCHWVSQNDHPHICGQTLPQDPKRACEHFRVAHDIRGNDKAIVGCHWYSCKATPMQRGSLVRHLLAVHLELLRWQCEACGRVFSRKGTGHACGGGGA